MYKLLSNCCKMCILLTELFAAKFEVFVHNVKFLPHFQDLQKKREEKRLENKKKAEEEVLFLQESGKIKTRPSRMNVKQKQPANKTRAKESPVLDSESELTLTQRSLQSSQRSPRDTDRSDRFNEVSTLGLRCGMSWVRHLAESP